MVILKDNNFTLLIDTERIIMGATTEQKKLLTYITEEEETSCPLF